jgi:hypothetical protein
MKNELKLTVERDADLIEVYRVQDSYRLYLITKNRILAYKTYKQLKLDYKKDKENAS